MGLDINFYRQNKSDHDDYDEVGYFRKVNFLLTYFDVHENDNCTDIPITKDQIESLAQDTNAELIHKNLDVDNKEPLNESLRTKKVFFGGSIDYDDYYWQDIECVRDWANDILKSFEWDKYNLVMCAWW